MELFFFNKHRDARFSKYLIPFFHLPPPQIAKEKKKKGGVAVWRISAEVRVFFFFFHFHFHFIFNLLQRLKPSSLAFLPP